MANPLPDSTSAADAAPGHFKRALTLFDAVMLVTGSMIGSGIFLVSADISRQGRDNGRAHPLKILGPDGAQQAIISQPAFGAVQLRQAQPLQNIAAQLLTIGKVQPLQLYGVVQALVQ
nr:hypothetical protein [Tanacetum cinerariifolium]